MVRPSVPTPASTGRHARAPAPMEKWQDQHRAVFRNIAGHGRADNSALNQRVRGSSPWRRTPPDLRFLRKTGPRHPRSRGLVSPSCVHRSATCLTAARQCLAEHGGLHAWARSWSPAGVGRRYQRLDLQQAGSQGHSSNGGRLIAFPHPEARRCRPPGPPAAPRHLAAAGPMPFARVRSGVRRVTRSYRAASSTVSRSSRSRSCPKRRTAGRS
jgi:hypothetical protein